MTDTFRNMCNINPRYKGILMALLGGAGFGTSNFFQKVAVLSLHPFQVAFFYSLTSLVLLVPYFLITRKFPVPQSGERVYVAAVAILQAVAYILIILSLSFLDLFECGIIMDTCPVFSAVVAWILLKEYFGIAELLPLLITVTGVILIAVSNLIFNGSNNPLDQVFGSLIAISAAICSAFNFCANRKVQYTDVQTVAWFVFFVLCTINLIVGTATKVIHFKLTSKEFGVILAISVLVTATMLLQITSLRLEPCLTATLAFCVDIPVSFLLQLIFLKVVPGPVQAIGAALIIISILLMAFKHYTLQAVNYLKSKLCADRAVDERSDLLSTTTTAAAAN